MSFSATITQEIKIAGQSISESHTHTSSSQLSISESVPDSQTDYEIACAIDVSEIKAIFIVSSQNVTFETNNGSTPDDTISLRADEPYVWYENSPYTNLLTTDITSVFITNASGSAAIVEIYCIQDATP